MYKRGSLILISFFLIFFFIAPLFVFAQENQQVNWPLQEKEVENLLDIIRKEPLTEANRDLFYKSLSHLYSDYPRKTGAVVLVKQAILNKQLNYWFKKVPWELSKKFIKAVFKVIPLIYGQDISTVIEIIEKYTVEKATEYAINWFLQNEIKIGTGEGSYTFLSYKNNWQKIDIPHIIAYHPLSPNKGKIAAEFYSKNSIEPPLGTGPNALANSQDNPNANCWPWDIWQENEKKRDNDGRLEPFIVRVTGYVIRDKFNYFSWDKSQGKPIIEVDFDSPVPDIDKNDIIWKSETVMKYHYVLEKILKPAVEKLQAIGRAFVKAKETTANLINKIKSSLSRIKPEVQIASQSPPGLDLQSLTEKTTDIEKGIEDIIKDTEKFLAAAEKTIEQTITEMEAPAEEGLVIPAFVEDVEPTLEELIERFDNISEEAEIVLAQAQELLSRTEPEVLVRGLAEKSPPQIRKNGISEESSEGETEKELEEELEQEEKEEEEEEEEEKEEMEESPEPEAEIEKEIIFCTLPGTQYPARNKIILNEIAWMGTIDSSNNEWFELKNISGSPVDLTGWQILDKDNQIKIAFENITLNPGGFFLLERSDDNAVPNISANFIYTGALSNSNEALYLFDRNCNLQDKVEALPSWPAGSNSSKKTLERKPDLSWQTSMYSGGTPKAENSAGEIYYTGGGNAATSPEESSKEPITCSQENLPSPIHSPVILNEIAWMGGISWRNEWIELKNVSENSVSLNGWQILDKDEQIKLFFESNDRLSANGFYLLEREEGAVLELSADKIYSGYLNNNNESLRLFDENCNLIDEALASPDWPGGDNIEKKTMERSSDLSWHTFDGEANNGILGTPDQENSEPLVEEPDGSSEEEEEGNGSEGEPEPETLDIEPPIAEAGLDQTVEINQPVNFDGTNSTDNVGITSFAWDIDESNGLDWENPDLTGQNPTLESGYAITGTYTVTIQIADETGNKATNNLIIVVNPPPEILISEIQITGQTAKDEFVELYNPNSFNVDLAGFSLKKKTSGGSEGYLVSAAKFSGTISSLGYFLITPQDKETGDLHYSGKDYSIAANNTVLLYSKYNNLIDETSAINHPKNYSFGRKWSTTETYQDFELQIPTPGAKNEKDSTVPEVKISSNPPILTNQTQAFFAFSANEEGSTFQCKIDEEGWQNCASPTNYSGLAEGPHLFQVKATDLVGNPSEIVEYYWTVDTTIESPILSLRDLDSTSSLFTNNQTVKVEILHDEEAAAWFLSENPEKPATNTPDWLNTKPSEFNLSAEQGSKTVYLWAKDATENVSQLGNSASIILDTISPQIEIEQRPSNPTNQVTTTFVFSCNEENCFFEYKLDNQPWQKHNKTVRSDDFVTFSDLAEGEHIFQVRAADQAGNTTLVPSQYSWLIDITPPSRISDLTAETGNEPGEIILTWTAPEDKGNLWQTIKPSGYMIKHYTEEITEENWNSARSITETPEPQEMGVIESFTVSGLTANTVCYFAIKSEDEAGNISLISNSTSSETLAAILEAATTTLNFIATQGGNNPPSQPIVIENKGQVNMDWSISKSANWILPAITSGFLLANSSTSVEIAIDISGMAASNYQATTTIESQDAKNSPQDIQVNLTLQKPLNQTPTAYFSYLPNENLLVGDEIAFDAASSTDPDGSIVSYAWDFGDSNSTTTEQATTTHFYTTSGDYTVLLTILDNTGATSSFSTTICIKPKLPLFLTVTFPSQNQVFTSSGIDTNNTIPDFQTIIEGTTTAHALVSVSQATTTLAATAASTIGKWELEVSLKEGENIFLFKAEDKFGQLATTSLTLILDTIPPIKITDLSAAGSDIDTIELSWTSPQEAIRYDIRFSTSTAIDKNNWDLAEQIPEEPSPSEPDSLQTFTITGLFSNTIYYFALKSEDENGNISEISNSPWGKTRNQPPISYFSYSPDENITVGNKITFNGSSSNDPDGEILSYIWNFGDEASTTTEQTIIVHSFAAAGEFLVSLVVQDNEGATSNTTSANIEVVEKPKPKILISEVQTESAANKKDEFIELYNPNEEEIDISQWSIQKSYSTSSTVYRKNFKAGHKIPAQGYFLIVNSNATSSLLVLTAQNGMTHNSFTLAENNTVYLVSKQEDIQTATGSVTDIVDKVGFGENVFSEGNPAQNPLSDPPPDKSIGRKWTTTTQEYKDTDNNQEDFELQIPTPKAKNEKGNILPPQPVENFQVSGGQTSGNTATLNWATTTDPDTPKEEISYIIYWAKGVEITEENATSATPNVFSTSTEATFFNFANLDYNSTYYFGIRAFDKLHYSLVATTSYATPLPSITDFQAAPSAQREAIDLLWTSPAIWTAPGAKRYLIKYAEKEIVDPSAGSGQATTNTEQISWEDATLVENSIIPKGIGETEIFIIENLTPDKTYYFAVKSINEVNATSEISNSSMAKAIPGLQDNGDGTITDLYTGLMWVKDGNSAAANNGATVTQDGAITFFSQLNPTGGFAGYNDWRVPGYRELASIVHYNKPAPTVDENFVNIKPDRYWTVSKMMTYRGYAATGDISRFQGWYVDFSTGEVGTKSYDGGNSPPYYLLPVRVPETACTFGLQDNGDGTVTNPCTNLMWTETELTGIGYEGFGRVDWKKAMEEAKKQRFGYSDWRLPNVRELMDIVGKVQTSSTGTFHWSSTPYYFNPDNYWFVSFWGYGPGVSSPVSKNYDYCVRLVRNVE